MIVFPRPKLLDVLFRVRGSVLPHIAPQLIGIGAISCLAVVLVEAYPATFKRLEVLPLTLIGLSLSIFMSFRNNACYDRWWEGRKLWGQLIISIRAFARQTAHLAPDVRAPLLRGLIGFTNGLAARLRDKPEVEAINRWSRTEDWASAPNPTDMILRDVGQACAAQAAAGSISDIHYSVLEQQLTALSLVQAGCERIKNTPVPYAFTLLLHRTAYAFCILLPFALAHALGWWTPLLVLIVSYTFFGLDALGDELEEPFGQEGNDLPIDAMTRLVERELLHAAGETSLPPILEPRKGVLH